MSSKRVALPSSGAPSFLRTSAGSRVEDTRLGREFRRVVPPQAPASGLAVFTPNDALHPIIDDQIRLLAAALRYGYRSPERFSCGPRIKRHARVRTQTSGFSRSRALALFRHLVATLAPGGQPSAYATFVAPHRPGRGVWSLTASLFRCRERRPTEMASATRPGRAARRADGNFENELQNHLFRPDREALLTLVPGACEIVSSK